MSRDLEPDRNELECPPDWRARKTAPRDYLNKLGSWLKEQSALFEAFWVAVTFHVLLFPLIWFAGWALPWPKPPSITTVIEINLENWPNEARPISIEELYETEMSKARAK